MKKIKALLIFCEGPHDVAFVKMILINKLNFKENDMKLSEFPSPFNQLFTAMMNQHASSDRTLRNLHGFFLPQIVLKNDSHFIFIFSCEGSNLEQRVKNLILALIPLLKQATVFPGNETTGNANEVATATQFLFLFDADSKGVTKILDNFNKKYATIDNDPWLSHSLSVSSINPMAAFNASHGVYVWGASPDQGTLEEHLMAMLRIDKAELIEYSSKAINEIFSWDKVLSDDTESSVAACAGRNKAIITLAGQGKKPGASMNVVIDQAKLISKETFCQDETVQAFATFLNSFMNQE